MREHNSAKINLAQITRTFIRICVIVLLIYFAHYVMMWFVDQAEAAQDQRLMAGLFITLILVYIILISIPFVPGIEIAISLMLIRGPDIVLVVYIATVCGLFLAFLAGTYLPYSTLKKAFQDLRMTKACNLLDTLEPLPKAERLHLIENKLPKFMKPLLINGRYLALAAVLNIPGNALIGGGGGILMAAGLSRVFSGWAIFCTLILAAAPIPIAILVFGIDPMAFLRTE